MVDQGHDSFFFLPLNLSAVSKNFIFTPGQFVRTYIFDILSNFQTHHSLEKKTENLFFLLVATFSLLMLQDSNANVP